MDFQTGFNVVLALAGFLGGWLLNDLSGSIKDLRKKDELLASEVHQVHLLVAGDYTKRSEFKSSMDAVFDSLRRIEDNLNAKVDK